MSDRGLKQPVTFRDIAGQDVAVAVLKASLASRRVAHAYMFRGPSGCGKATTGRVFARYLLCPAVVEGRLPEPCGHCPSCLSFVHGTHPDFFDIGEGRRMLGIDESHQIIEDSVKRPYLAPRKVFLLRDVENMTREAANALLKALEEPAPSTCFILTSSNAARVPDTVLSRCQVIPFRPLPVKVLVDIVSGVPGLTPDIALEAARFAGGSVEKTLLILERWRAAESAEHISLGDIFLESPVMAAERYSRMDPESQSQFLEWLAIELEKSLELSVESRDSGGRQGAGLRFYRECLLSVMRARRRLDRNVSPFLTFAGLFLELRHLLEREKGSG